ncbi:MAG: hypothetical protein ABIK61_00940 [candidate division WOR-3 bacterium]
MKYTITINQLGILYAGLIFETDLIDWAIVDYLKDFIYYKQSKRVIYQGEEYIWLNYKHLMSSMPLIHLPDKRTLWRRISKLRRLGLIKTLKTKDNTLYYTFTDRLVDICFSKKSHIKRLKDKGPVSNMDTGPVSIMDTGGVSNMDTAQYITKYQLETNNQLVTKNNINDISFSFFKEPNDKMIKRQREEFNPTDEKNISSKQQRKELNPEKRSLSSKNREKNLFRFQ